MAQVNDSLTTAAGTTLTINGGISLAAATSNVCPTLAYRTVAEDVALTIVATDRVINLLSSLTGTKAATIAATHQGHEIEVILTAWTAGAYTIACDRNGTTGTVTLNAAGERTRLVCDGTTWHCLELDGATFA